MPAMSNPIQGTDIRSRAVFRDVDDELFDPVTVTFMLRDPDGDETSYVYLVDGGVARDSLGVYHFWHPTPIPSTYLRRWKGVDSSGHTVAGELELEVEASGFDAP